MRRFRISNVINMPVFIGVIVFVLVGAYAQAIQVNTTEGLVEGYKAGDGDYHVFYGIPYGGPTDGPKRFKVSTIISEWAEGALFWDKILSSTTEYQKFASAVVAIAKTLKFDGYLLNIENKILKPQVLLEFVKHLHETLHRELKDPVLIWYDSVTIKGKLDWQNGLNEKNIDFFHACDGFFTNYSWSADTVTNSAKMAGARITDLYIGIDVWGRNFYGGGQFNTQEAVKVAHKEGCSLAIFAPAWTHESMNSDPTDVNFVRKGEGLNKLERFLLRDRALWDTLWPFLHTHLPCHLPFQTSFCKGQGKKRWMYGEVISPGPWYNLRHQQYQPNATHGRHGYSFSLVKSLPKPPKPASNTALQGVKKGIIKCDLHDRSLCPQESSTGVGSRRASSEVIRTIQQMHQPAKPTGKKPRVYRFKRFVERIIGPCHKSKEGPSNSPPTTSKSIDVENATSSNDQNTVTPHAGADNTSMVAPIVATAITPPGTLAPEETKSQDGSKSPLEPVSPTDTMTSIGSTMSTSPLLPVEAKTQLRPQYVPISTDELQASNSLSMLTMPLNIHLTKLEGKLRWVLTFNPLERECLQVYLQDAFNGGSSIKVNPSDTVNPEHRLTRLLHCDFVCQMSFIICVVTKPMVQYEDQTLNVILRMVNRNGNYLELKLVGTNVDLSSSLTADMAGINCVYPLYSNDQQEFQELRKYLLMHQPDFYVPIENHYGWEIRYYNVTVPGSRILSVNCLTTLDLGGILLGHFGICSRSAPS